MARARKSWLTSVQANSAVRAKPYLKVNLGALPNDLIEAELFGTETGAFTGARARTGRFEAADGGTLFLDELGNLSGGGQAKLLRVLQTGEFERLGSNTTRRTRVRVIAATNTNLRGAIREGKFREDLFYRLNVIELEMPRWRSGARISRCWHGISWIRGSRSRRMP